jgi:hypothetical protein
MSSEISWRSFGPLAGLRASAATKVSSVLARAPPAPARVRAVDGQPKALAGWRPAQPLRYAPKCDRSALKRPPSAFLRSKIGEKIEAKS